MAFDPTHPIHDGLPESDPIRENFVQLAAHHRGSVEPANKSDGFVWWDTSTPTNEKLRAYTGGGWVDLFNHMESTPVPAVSGAASWQGSVKDKDLTAPPGSPTLGDRYIVASPATGDWFGKEDDIAEWNGSVWVFDTPVGGWTVWVDDESEIYVFNGSSWGQESFGPHAATHTSGADKLPNSNVGDVLQHNGSQWGPAQFAAAGTEFLVGPAGTAKYTSIQAAINAASPGDIVYVLPGTYAETLYISRTGVIVEAVVPISSRVLGAGRMPPTVVVQGQVNVYVEDHWELRLSGLKIQPSSGNAISVSFGYSFQHQFLMQLYNCEVVGVNAEPLYLGTQGQGLTVDGFNTSFDRTDSGTCITLSHQTHKLDLESCSVTGSTVAVDVSGQAAFRMHDSLGHQEGLIGRLNISGDAVVQLVDVRISPISGDHVVVATNLLGTPSFWHNVLGGDDTDECQSITISGANAHTFVERPEGVVRRSALTTTTVTQATLVPIYIPDDTAYRIEAEVAAFRTNGADQATYKRAALVYRRSAGVAVLEGVQDISTDIESDANWDVDIDVDGSNYARIRVTGADGKTINWKGFHTIKEVS